MRQPLARALRAALAELKLRCGLRFGLAFALAALLVFGASSSTASAHTRLLETIPASRTITAEAPERLTLVFAEPVDPRSVRLEIITPDGESIPGATLLTETGADSATIEFALPGLPHGIFGLSWVTIGPDGHRVAGEVVLGIGIVDSDTVASASFARTPRLDRALELLNATSRYVWYISLASVAGAMLVLAWHLGVQYGRSGATGVLVSTARRSLVVGAAVLHVSVLARTITTITLVTRGYGDGSWREHLSLALDEVTGRALILAVLGSGLLTVFAQRLGRARSGLPLLQAGIGMAVLIVLCATPSHTATLSEDPFGIWIATLHLAAASIWLGPLLIFGLAMASPAWRERPSPERSVAMARLFNRFTPVAAGAFTMLLLTGLRSFWLLAGDELLGGSGYATILLVKLLLVALVVVPLGLYHDRRQGWLSRLRRHPERRAPALSPRTLRLEASAMVGVLALAAILTGLNPAILGNDRGKSSASTVDAYGEGEVVNLALLSSEPPSSADECAKRIIGKYSCYLDYFVAIMQERGADMAVAEVEYLSKADEYVASNCHQIVHDLGNTAVVWYGDVGVALSYQGSACWSGYYHGVVEYAISRFDDADLADELPEFCAELAIRKYSFAHFNCVHGLGHGIMQILGGDLFDTIPYCEVFDDPWEDSACMNGALMENVITGQQGSPVNLRTDDLVYPCNAVPDIYVADCFATQTSWMLTNTGYRTEGFAQVFAICDGVRADMVANCYRALGRDISSVNGQDPIMIVRLCSLGDPEFQASCYVGAATNAIYNDHNTITATEICNSIRARMRRACFQARDNAALTL